jgi:hypothetical protein
MVEQNGETFWRIQRVQNIRDGLALKSVQRKAQGLAGCAPMTTGGRLLEPNVASYQCFREGPGGNSAKKEIKLSTFKAGMYMKTKDNMTICPEKRRKFCVSAGYVYDILCRSKRILRRPWALLSFFEPWGTACFKM